jgi:GxxExxY protein
MHPLYAEASRLTQTIIGAAIEVHKDKGPGLVESIYEWCFNQKVVKIHYKGFVRDEPLRFDLLVNECVLLEIKSVESILPVHKAQLLSYMKLLDVPLGLLINFNVNKLTDGVSRLILPGADK